MVEENSGAIPTNDDVDAKAEAVSDKIQEREKKKAAKRATNQNELKRTISWKDEDKMEDLVEVKEYRVSDDGHRGYNDEDYPEAACCIIS